MAYPASLAPQLNQVPEDVEAAHIAASQGGMIGGHEFDMPISQPTHTQPHPSSHLPGQNTPAPVPRPSSSSHRPRPVSMPPQSYNVPPSSAGNGGGSVSGATTTSSQDTRDRDRSQMDENSHRRRHREERSERAIEHSSSNRTRSSNRILGDYTLSKTLGAGSMGKVKLATHNITGEKVRWSYPPDALIFLL